MKKKVFEMLLDARQVCEVFGMQMPSNLQRPPKCKPGLVSFWDPGWCLADMFVCIQRMGAYLIWPRDILLCHEECFAAVEPQYRTFPALNLKQEMDLNLPARQTLMWLLIRRASGLKSPIENKECLLCKPGELRDGRRILIRSKNDNIMLVPF